MAIGYCRRCASDSWLPREVAAALVGHGHLRIARSHAEAGDWHCARALTVDSRLEDSTNLLRPFVDHGHWEAVEILAGFLEKDGRGEEAIALVRSYLREGGPYGAVRLAELLARQSHVDEVVELLAPHAADQTYARSLVELTAGGEHDDVVAEVLRDRLDAENHRTGSWPHLPSETPLLLAKVLERQGQVDDAVALLEAVPYGNAALADLFARRDLEAELRALAGEHAACRLAAWLEEKDRVDEAVSVLRSLVGDGSASAGLALAALQVRHGRADEAIEVLRAAPDPEWILPQLCDVLISQDRANDALAAIDSLSGGLGDMTLELRLHRYRVLARSGRLEEAITAIGDDPDAGTEPLVMGLAGLLDDAGRLGEAIAVLRSVAHLSAWGTVELATRLVRDGRADEAVALFTAEAAAKQSVKAEADADFWRQFRGVPLT